MINLQVSPEAPAHHPCATSKALGRNGLFSVGTGGGCCALASLFKRKTCAWQGQQQLWDMLGGGGRPKGEAAALHTSQGSVCSSHSGQG